MTHLDDETIAPITAAEFPHIISLCDLGSEETHITVHATPEERAALTKRLGVVAIKELILDAVLKISSSGDIVAKVNLEAAIDQHCCVTLDPVCDNVSVSYTMTYAVQCDLEADKGEDVFEDVDNPYEPSEPVSDGKIDICDVAIEQLALEINPFPRVKGVVFDGFTTGHRDGSVSKTEKVSPFAALSKLKPRI